MSACKNIADVNVQSGAAVLDAVLQAREGQENSGIGRFNFGLLRSIASRAYHRRWKLRERLACLVSTLRPSCRTACDVVNIFVKTLTGKTITLAINLRGTVSCMKQQIQIKFGVPIEQQRLLFAGIQLQDGRKISDYGITRDSTVWMTGRLRGGMKGSESGKHPSSEPRGNEASEVILGMFRATDARGEGLIKRSDLVHVLRALNISEENLERAVMLCDRNGDGSIVYEDFVNWAFSGEPVPKKPEKTCEAAIPQLGPIGDQVIRFIEQVQGFIKCRDAVETEARKVLPHAYMDGHPSFKVLSKMKQIKNSNDSLMTLEELMAVATRATNKFKDVMTNIVTRANLNPDEDVFYNGRPLMIDEDKGLAFKRLSIAGLKSRARCEEKIAKEYDGDVSRLVDVVRCSIVVDTEEQLRIVAEALCGTGSNGECEVVRLKNRFKEPLFNGYRDALYNIRVCAGEGEWHVCEVQLHLAAVLFHKAESHIYYEFFRTYFAGNVAVVESRMRVLEDLCRSDADVTLSAGEILHAAMASSDDMRLKALAELLGPHMIGEATLVVPVQRRRLALAEENLSDETTVAQLQHEVAQALCRAGHYNEALELFGKALAVREKALGLGHSSVSETLSSIAIVKDMQGSYDEALELYGKALAIKEKALGPAHSDVGDTLNNIAAVKNEQGRYDEALELFGKALAIKEKALGPEHSEVGSMLNNIGAVKDTQGSHDEALELYGRALAIREKALGPEHPDVGGTLINMGNVKYDQDSYDEALELYGKALAIKERALGPEHPDVGTTLNNMGKVKYEQDSYDEALELYGKALAIREKALGLEHPDVGDTLHSMGKVKYSQDRNDEALELFGRALAITEKALGPEHPGVGSMLNDMGDVKYDQDSYDEALELYGKALAIKEKALGPEHPDVTELLGNIADLKRKQSRAEYASSDERDVSDVSDAGR